MSIKEMQILQFENEELRKRVKELKDKIQKLESELATYNKPNDSIDTTALAINVLNNNLTRLK